MSVSAQKGSMYLGASSISFWGDNNIGTGFFYSQKGDISITSYGISPEFGYFISDKVAFGFIIGISGSKTENRYYYGYMEDDPLFPGTVVEKEFTFRFNPYTRYFLIREGSFGLYLQGGLNFEVETEGKFNKFGAFMNPGVSYAISSSFTATASFGNLGFQTISEQDAYASTTYVFGLNLNMSTLNFSLSYTF